MVSVIVILSLHHPFTFENLWTHSYQGKIATEFRAAELLRTEVTLLTPWKNRETLTHEAWLSTCLKKSSFPVAEFSL